MIALNRDVRIRRCSNGHDGFVLTSRSELVGPEAEATKT
jgi:hypothetical protein